MDERTPGRSHSYDSDLARAMGRTIKVLRTDVGLERRELAKRVGISYSYLTEIENGNKPASNTILSRVAEVLGMRLHELIEASEARLASQRGLEERPLFEPDPSFDLRADSAASPMSPSARRLRASRSSSLQGDESYSPAAPGLSVSPRSPAGDGISGSPGQAWSTSRNEMPAGVSPEIMDEIVALLNHLGREDQLRVLDLARRLAR